MKNKRIQLYGSLASITSLSLSIATIPFMFSSISYSLKVYLLLTIILLLSHFISFYIGYKINSKRYKNYSFTVDTILEFELKSNEIWIVTKNLHYDIKHHNYIKAIKENLGNGKKYRYIVQESDSFIEEISIYKETYNLNDSQINNMFRIFPKNNMLGLLRTTVIYNPKKNNMFCCAFGPVTESGSQQCIQFDKQESIKTVGIFEQMWLKGNRIPADNKV